MFEFVTGRLPLYNQVHVHVRRISLDDVPTEGQAFKQWLHDRFVEKDR